jgi:biopolymer transport protein ExbB/TolQ
LPSIKGHKLKPENVAYLKSIGLFALITGIFAQLLSLYYGFEAISQVESVSPALLAGGLKVSMITTIYGVLIYIMALLISLLLQSKVQLSQPIT